MGAILDIVAWAVFDFIKWTFFDFMVSSVMESEKPPKGRQGERLDRFLWLILLFLALSFPFFWK